VDDPDEKTKALDILMENYANPPFGYRPSALEKTRVIRVDIEKMSGKRN
jgi:nitroimidazol reductase NimA-like FMN-containing flavoprotein (pyridoxamine 5'-phosphate oxidase superfamily)